MEKNIVIYSGISSLKGELLQCPKMPDQQKQLTDESVVNAGKGLSKDKYKNVDTDMDTDIDIVHCKKDMLCQKTQKMVKTNII